MEMNFDCKYIHHLKSVINETKNQEITQEYRLPEDMPEIGSVLGAWGQCVVKEKRWLGNQVEVAGEAIVSVAYLEASEAVQCIETCVPFQFIWDIQNIGKDGHINVVCNAVDVEARVSSARKIIIRAEILANVNAFVSCESTISVPDESADHIQFLTRDYQFLVPMACGEKAFPINEMIKVSATYPQIHRMLKSFVRLEITDKKVITSKVVFRGVALISLSYLSNDGAICSWEGEIPFSQYANLDGEYDDCYIRLQPVLSGVENKYNAENEIAVSIGVICQYTVFGYQNLRLIKDAYAPGMYTEIHESLLNIPTLLLHEEELVHMEHQVDIPARTVMDVSVLPGKPILNHENSREQVLLPVEIKIIYSDMDSKIQCEHIRITKQIDEAADVDVHKSYDCVLSGTPRASVSASGCCVGFDVLVCSMQPAEESLRVIESICTYEQEPNEKKASLIIGRANGCSLWEIGKKYGASVDRIKKINSLSAEPEYDKVLIVPIS